MVECRRLCAARAMPEDQIMNVEPPPMRAAGRRGADGKKGRRRFADQVGAREIGVLTGETLEMRGDRGDDAARLLRVLPDHIDAAQEQHPLRTHGPGRLP